MNNISVIENCMGCSACSKVCHKSCIKMEKNKYGFFYPKIKKEACVSCGICLQVCPTIKHSLNKTLLVIGARNIEADVLAGSTSGGVFSAISDYYLENDGFVCGAIFNKDYCVIHDMTNISECREKMRGVKYVQSNIEPVILEIIEKIKQGKKVIFFGTPCQVSAINNMGELKKINKKLLTTVDLICHGVPSPGLFSDHIRYIKIRYGEIESYLFRDKEKGWRGQNVTINTAAGVVSDEDAKSYCRLYFNSLITRPSCETCPFAVMERAGDLTIGDFWGIDKEDKRYDDNKGISLLLINTEQGEKLFNTVKDRLDFFMVQGKSYIQPNMTAPTEKNPLSDIFWKMYGKEGFEAYKRYFKQEKVRMLPVRVIKKIRRMLEVE